MGLRDAEEMLEADKADAVQLERENANLRDAVRQWEDWSNQLAAALPEQWDGDEAQEDIIQRFVEHATRGSILTPEEAEWFADLLRAEMAEYGANPDYNVDGAEDLLQRLRRES